jgi:outer membrane protein TolC
MKTIPFIFALCICCTVAFAQTVDYNKIILPEKATDITFEERVLQLAWKNGPLSKETQLKTEIAHYETKGAQWSWLNDISAVGNLNEFTLNPDDPVLGQRAAFFPRYNFGVRVSLGTLFLTPLKSKEARTKELVTVYEVDRRKLELREEVMNLIHRLVEQHLVVKLRSRLSEDLLIMYQESEKKFSAGQITIDQYRNASQAYYIREETVILSKSQFNQRKVELESLIGLKLEDVQGYKEFLDKAESYMK